MLLDRFEVFRSENVDEIAKFIRANAAGEIRDPRLLKGGKGFRYNEAVSSTFALFSLSSDLSASFVLGPASHLRLIFPTCHRNRVVVLDNTLDTEPSDAGCFVPEGVSLSECHKDGFRCLGIRIDPATLQRRLGALCGQDINGAIKFEQPLRSDQNFVDFVRRPLFAAARELDLIGSEFVGQVLADLETVTLTRLLLFARHSHSHMLEKADVAPRGAQMGRAEDFIALNWNRPIDMDGIAKAAGVSSRTILRYFQQKYGETPRAYLRKLRLLKAREMLLAAGAKDTVVAIALRCGFSSFGHFAEAYRRKFGELPSATLKRKD